MVLTMTDSYPKISPHPKFDGAYLVTFKHEKDDGTIGYRYTSCSNLPTAKLERDKWTRRNQNVHS